MATKNQDEFRQALAPAALHIIQEEAEAIATGFPVITVNDSQDPNILYLPLPKNLEGLRALQRQIHDARKNPGTPFETLEIQLKAEWIAIVDVTFAFFDYNHLHCAFCKRVHKKAFKTTGIENEFLELKAEMGGVNPMHIGRAMVEGWVEKFSSIGIAYSELVVREFELVGVLCPEYVRKMAIEKIKKRVSFAREGDEQVVAEEMGKFSTLEQDNMDKLAEEAGHPSILQNNDFPEDEKSKTPTMQSYNTREPAEDLGKPSITRADDMAKEFHNFHHAKKEGSDLLLQSMVDSDVAIEERTNHDYRLDTSHHISEFASSTPEEWGVSYQIDNSSHENNVSVRGRGRARFEHADTELGFHSITPPKRGEEEVMRGPYGFKAMMDELERRGGRRGRYDNYGIEHSELGIRVMDGKGGEAGRLSPPEGGWESPTEKKVGRKENTVRDNEGTRGEKRERTGAAFLSSIRKDLARSAESPTRGRGNRRGGALRTGRGAA